MLSYNATVALVRAVFLASTFFEASTNAEDLPPPSFATSRTLCMLATRHDAHSASKLMEIIFGDLIASLPETPPCYSSKSASCPKMVRVFLSFSSEGVFDVSVF